MVEAVVGEAGALAEVFCSPWVSSSVGGVVSYYVGVLSCVVYGTYGTFLGTIYQPLQRKLQALQ